MFSVEEVDPNGFRTAAIVMIPLFSLPVIIGVFMLRSAPRKVAERVPAILAAGQSLLRHAVVPHAAGDVLSAGIVLDGRDLQPAVRAEVPLSA